MLNNPISLITGVPGAGKSLRAVWHGIELAKAGRKVFFYNMDGLDPSKIEADFDATVYNVSEDFTMEKWRELPSGSVLIIDEAHKYFPVRQKDAVPSWMVPMTEARHFGIQIILVTQDPRNLDAFVRRLVGEHEHLNRKAGLNGALVRTFQQISENPDDYHAKESASAVPWVYPKKIFDVYKSASLHVIKPKFPKKILFAVVLIPLIIGFLIYAYMKVTDMGSEPEGNEAPKSQKSALGLNNEQEKSVRETAWKDSETFVKAHTPLIPVAPWSAPIYEGTAPTRIPEIYCIASGLEGSKDRSCNCYTEQVTKIRNIPVSVCEQAVKDGIYNPYKPLPSTNTAPIAGQGSTGALPPGGGAVITSDEPVNTILKPRSGMSETKSNGT